MSYPPNDTYFPSQWTLPLLNIEGAWAITKGSGVLVALLDSGVEVGHPDLSANIVLPGYNGYDDSTDVTPVYGHGTWCCGILAAAENNGVGIAGVAPECGVIPMVCSNASGTPSDAAMAACIYQAIERGARVCSASFSMATIGPQVAAAVDAYDRWGGVFVTGLANSNIDQGGPNLKNIIHVSGVNASFDRIYAYGDILDIVVPTGNTVITTSGSSGYLASFGGNSAAVAMVSGVAALILSIRPDLGPADVRAIMFQSANDTANVAWNPGWDKYKGWGLLDAAAAVALAQIWVSIGSHYPEVEITSPAPGVIPAGLTTVSVSATDDSAVAQVELLVDGVVEGTLTNAPYEFLWTPPTVGQYSLTARVTDFIGQQTSCPIKSVTVLGIHAASTTTLDLTYLDPCKSYDVRVRAVNSGGAGPWSDWETEALACMHNCTGALGSTGASLLVTANTGTVRTSSTTLANAGASIAGASARFRAHASNSSLTNTGAALTATTTRFRPHESSSVLTTAGSTLAADVSRANGLVTHSVTSVLGNAGAALSGISTRFRAHATDSALVNAGANLAGSADSKTIRQATAGLTGVGASIAGASARTRVHASSSSLTNSGATLTGQSSTSTERATAGTLAGVGASIAATATRIRTHASSSALAATGAAIDGAAKNGADPITHATTSLLGTAGSTLTAVSARNATHAAVGTLLNTGAALAGATNRSRSFNAAGILVGQSAQIAAAAARNTTAVTHTASAALAGGGAEIAATAVKTRVHEVASALAGTGGSMAAISGHNAIHTSQGILAGADAILFGAVANGTDISIATKERVELASHITRRVELASHITRRVELASHIN